MKALILSVCICLLASTGYAAVSGTERDSEAADNTLYQEILLAQKEVQRSTSISDAVLQTASLQGLLACSDDSDCPIGYRCLSGICCE